MKKLKHGYSKKVSLGRMAIESYALTGLILVLVHSTVFKCEQKLGNGIASGVAEVVGTVLVFYGMDSGFGGAF